MDRLNVDNEEYAMSSLINKLTKREVWQAYLEHKLAFAQLNKREEAELIAFVESETWLPVARKIEASPWLSVNKGSELFEGVVTEVNTLSATVMTSTSGTPLTNAENYRPTLAACGLDIPEKRLINKLGKQKKRVVYTFVEAEQQVLKLLSWLLYAYDEKQPEHCYSFRRGVGAHKAIRTLTSQKEIDDWYCYKVDIQDYFNSINTERLLAILAKVLDDDEQLLGFFRALLQEDKALLEGQVICEKRGVMAGTPTAPFFANLYLGEMDTLLASKACAYARYSDDIIMFARSAAEIEELKELTAGQLREYGLKVNPIKEHLSKPGESWEFLGIAYQQGVVNLSAATQRKLKGKIRRKARALRRWMLRKDASVERATAAMIRSMNRKFFEGGASHELTWSRWFFPLLTSPEGLKTMDAYLQQELRTIATGRHSKTNYRMSYAKLKELGYKSLVHEYYLQKEAVQNNTMGKSKKLQKTRLDIYS